MKKPIFKLIAGGSLVTALALAGSSWAMGPGGNGSHDPGRMIHHMMNKLDLDSEQKSQVEALLNVGHEARAADRQRIGELRRELASQRGDFDAGQAQTMADEIGEITSRMVFQFSNSQAQIYALLNEQQRTEFDAMIEHRQARKSKWKHGRQAQH